MASGGPDFLRTSNFLATLADVLQGRIEAVIRTHPNQTQSSLAALNIIGMYEGCTNNELSRAIGLSHTATVRLADRLEGDGLITSAPGRDRRSVVFALTEAGRTYARNLLQQRCGAAGAVLELLSAEEQAQLNGLLETLLARVSAVPAAGGHMCRLCDTVACPPERCPVHMHETGGAG